MANIRDLDLTGSMQFLFVGLRALYYRGVCGRLRRVWGSWIVMIANMQMGMKAVFLQIYRGNYK